MNDCLDGDLLTSTAGQFPGFLRLLRVQIRGCRWLTPSRFARADECIAAGDGPRTAAPGRLIRFNQKTATLLRRPAVVRVLFAATSRRRSLTDRLYSRQLSLNTGCRDAYRGTGGLHAGAGAELCAAAQGIQHSTRSTLGCPGRHRVTKQMEGTRHEPETTGLDPRKHRTVVARPNQPRHALAAPGF